MLPFSPIASTPLADDGGVSVVQYSLTADAGTFTYSGQDAVLQFGDNFVAAEGSFALTGQDANLTKSVSLSVDAGSFAVTGQAIDLDASKAVSLDAGSFTSTGQNVAFTIGFDATVDLVEYGVSVASGTNSYGTGNKFYVSGSPDASPTLRLQAGITYRFDQSDSSNSGHPFRFSTTPDGTHDSGSEYTTGVTKVGTAGSAGAYVEIEVTGSTPTLYYYCSNHSGMGGKAETNAKLYNAVAQDAVLNAQYQMSTDDGQKVAVVVNFRSYPVYKNINEYFYFGLRTSLGGYSDVIIYEEPTVSFSTTMLSEVGSFSLTGQDIDNQINFNAASGSFSITENDAGLNYKPQVSFDAGTFTSTAQDASFAVSRPSGTGSFTLTGQEAALTNQYVMEAFVGIQAAINYFGTLYKRHLDENAFFYVGQSQTLNNFSNVIVPTEPTVSFSTSMLAETGTFSLTGLPHNKAISEAARHVSLSYSGQANQFAINFPVDTGSFSTTGQDADFTATISANSGEFDLTGQDATLSFAVFLNAESGSFSATSQDANFTKDLEVSADAGSFSQNEQDTSFDINFVSANGSFSVVGQDVAVTKDIIVTPDAANFTLAGQDALKGISEIAADVEYTFTGQAVSFSVNFDANNGNFALTGQDALKDITEVTPAVSFALTGQDVAFAIQITMIVDAAAFAFTGQDARVKFVLNRFEFDSYEQQTVFSKSGTTEVTTGLANSVDVEAVDENALELYELTQNSVIVEPTYNKAA